MSKDEQTPAERSAAAHDALYKAQEALSTKPSKAADKALKEAKKAADKAIADLLKVASQKAALSSKGQASLKTSPNARPGSPGGGRFRAETGFVRQ